MATSESLGYKRTVSTDDGLGFRYETKMTALAALRLFRTSDEFFLANNFEKGEKFDDIVFTAKINNQWLTWFIQLKHKQVSTLDKKKISISTLRSKGDFVLRKYFDSYKVILQKFKKGANDVIFGKGCKEAKFLIVTNASFHDDILRRKHEHADIRLLSTNNMREINLKFDMYKDQDILLGMIGDPQVPNFLDNLYFCTQHANEGDMDLIVQNEINEISKGLSAIDVKYVTNQMYDFIYSWLKTGEFLTKEKVKEILSRTSFETQSGKRNETTLQFVPSFLKFCENFGSDKFVCLVSKADSTAMCMTCLKQLGLLDEPNMLFPLRQLEKDDVREHLLKEATKPSNGKTFVIDCEGDILGLKKECIVEFLKQLGNINIANRVMLVTTQGNSSIIGLNSLLQAKSRKFNCTLKDLTDMSKKMLMEREVLFQGHKTLLASVMPNMKVMEDVFDMASITQLLQGRLVNVGIKPVEQIPYYVTRVLTRQSTVQPEIFTDQRLKACFALSGITLEQAIMTLPISSGIVSSLNLVDTTGTVMNNVIILEGDPEIEFEALSKRVPLPFHWFEKTKKGAKKWHWKKSTGNIADVSAYVDNTLDYIPMDNIMVIKDKVVVITAEPGMGKSTLLEHLAAETKRLCPHIWVISVILNDFTEHLDKPAFMRNVEVATKNLIATAAGVGKETSKFDARLFNQCYDVTGNMIVLLDGFDEITPYYTKQGLALLRTLQKSRVSRVWVTARPVLCDLLENVTSTLSFNIKPFETKDQKNFLAKYWKHELPSIDEKMLSGFIDKVLELIEISFDEKLHEFTGIPLQTRMLAEVFLADVRSLHDTGELKLKDRINGVQLFEDFVQIKRGIQMEKAMVTVSNASARWLQKSLNDALEKDLMSLALLTILPRNVCAELFPPISDILVQKLKKDVADGNEKSGIVLSFKGESPQFIHRTFAEYFVALFFTKGFESNRKFLTSDAFFASTFEFVKYFFDRILAAGKALHEAVLDKDVVRVLETLEAGVDVDSVDAGGRTALHVAAGIPESGLMIRKLLDAGAHLDIADSVLGWKPMHYAVRVASVDNIAPLLEVSQESLDKGSVPITRPTLRHAVQNDHLKLFLHLLEHGIYAEEDLDELSPQQWIDDSLSEGLSILHVASAFNSLKILEYLLRKDTRDCKRRFIEIKTPDGMTPLLLAASRGCTAAVNLLVSAGANSLATTPDGKNLVQFSVMAQDLDMLHTAVKDALGRKAHPETFLPMAVTTLIGDKTEWGLSALQLLFSLYPKLGDLKTTKGVPLIVAAAIKGNETAVRRLCELNADVNIMAAHGTPLHLAVTGGHEDVVRELLACPRTNVNARDENGRTPLYNAAAKGYTEIFQMLIDVGAEINCSANDGSDLSHAVSVSCDENIFFYLVETGISFLNSNTRGETGLSLLKAAGATSLVQIIAPCQSVPEPQPEVVKTNAVPAKLTKKKRNKVPAIPLTENVTSTELSVESMKNLNPPKAKKSNPPKTKKTVPPPPQPQNQGPKKEYDTHAFLDAFKDLTIKSASGDVDITEKLKAFIELTIASAQSQKANAKKQRIKNPPAKRKTSATQSKMGCENMNNQSGNNAPLHQNQNAPKQKKPNMPQQSNAKKPNTGFQMNMAQVSTLGTENSKAMQKNINLGQANKKQNTGPQAQTVPPFLVHEQNVQRQVVGPQTSVPPSNPAHEQNLQKHQPLAGPPNLMHQQNIQKQKKQPNANQPNANQPHGQGHPTQPNAPNKKVGQSGEPKPAKAPKSKKKQNPCE